MVESMSLHTFCCTICICPYAVIRDRVCLLSIIILNGFANNIHIIYIYIYMYIYMYMCICMCMCMRMHIHMHIHIHTRARTCICTCTYTYTYTHIEIDWSSHFVSIYLYIYIYIEGLIDHHILYAVLEIYHIRCPVCEGNTGNVTKNEHHPMFVCFFKSSFHKFTQILTTLLRWLFVFSSKWITPSSRRHFEMHFYERKVLYFVVWFAFYWGWFPIVQLTICHHWFRQWFCAK